MLGVIGHLQPVAPGIFTFQPGKLAGNGAQEGRFPLAVVAENRDLLTPLNLEADR